MKTSPQKLAYDMEWRKRNPEKVAASRRNWRLANPEKVTASRRRWMNENKKKRIEYNIEWQKRNPEKVAAYRRKWVKNNPGKMAKFAREYHKRNPEKARAQNKVHSALRNGTLKKQPCVVCGSVKAEAHHPDYSKPLEVTWVCHFHHFQIHIKEWHDY